MANTEIRMKIAATGVKQWEIAEMLGMAETSFSRKLRKEVSEDEKNRILSAIDKLTAEKQA